MRYKRPGRTGSWTDNAIAMAKVLEYADNGIEVGTILCPVCGKDKLDFAVTRQRGVWVRCRQSGCVRFLK
jgi:hypothetical protein